MKTNFFHWPMLLATVMTFSLAGCEKDDADILQQTNRPDIAVTGTVDNASLGLTSARILGAARLPVSLWRVGIEVSDTDTVSLWKAGVEISLDSAFSTSCHVWTTLSNLADTFSVEISNLHPDTLYYFRTCVRRTAIDSIFVGRLDSFSPLPCYIDLALPSGVRWSTCNIGAERPEIYGHYYAWGEGEPKDDYCWKNYKYCNGSYDHLTKYCTSSDFGPRDNKKVLDPSDCAFVYANQQNGARMPTVEEWEELISETNSSWTCLNGIFGREFLSQNGNSIFLPAAGCYFDTTLYKGDSTGYYWTASLGDGVPSSARCIDFGENRMSVNGRNRSLGMSVRAVRQ